MKTRKALLLQILFIVVPVSIGFSQKEIEFGAKKIHISGEEISSYTLTSNSHLVKNYLQVENGVLLYTSVEMEGTLPVKIELTECELSYLDNSSCAVAASDQASVSSPGNFYLLYIYTNKDAANIITTVYDDPSSMARVQKSSVARLKFVSEQTARKYLTEYIQ